MTVDLMPILWVLITLPILLLSQRWIHRHLHGVAFLLTGNKNWALALYAIMLFPGVLLHELSHWLTATLVGVRTGSFSLLPRAKEDGTVQLGYVEYYKTGSVGPLRESLIGSAPLIFGTAVVLLIALRIFDVESLGLALNSGDVDDLTLALSDLFVTGDILLWLYLLFAIGNAMMPSASDRRAWPAFALIMLVFATVVYLLGLQQVIVTELAGPVATVFGYLGLAFSLTIGVNLFFIFLIHLFESLLSRFRGVDLVYSKVNQSPPGS
jgi:hypothetical protein